MPTTMTDIRDVAGDVVATVEADPTPGAQPVVTLIVLDPAATLAIKIVSGNQSQVFDVADLLEGEPDRKPTPDESPCPIDLQEFRGINITFNFPVREKRS
jgi:hypothetical protein